MNINLDPQWMEFIDKRLKSGRYLSASEVVREGLRLLHEKEQLQELRLEQLRREVGRGIASLDQGDCQELDEQGMKAYLDGVNRRGRERLARQEPPPGQ